MRTTKVKDVMTAHPVLIAPNTTLKDASVRMRDIDCGVLPIGREDRVKGIITDRDIVVRALSHSKDADEEMVRDYMTTEIFDCNENDSLETAVNTMKKHKVGRLLVKNKAGKVTGIISFGDILWRGANAEEVAAIIEQAIRERPFLIGEG